MFMKYKWNLFYSISFFWAGVLKCLTINCQFIFPCGGGNSYMKYHKTLMEYPINRFTRYLFFLWGEFCSAPFLDLVKIWLVYVNFWNVFHVWLRMSGKNRKRIRSKVNCGGKFNKSQTRSEANHDEG